MTKEKTDKKADKKTFEQALAELERIVAQIEQGEVSLEESINKYAEGTKLIEQCRKILSAAEKKIQMLTATDSGELKCIDQSGEGRE